MRLIVGCTLTDQDLAAVQKGEDLRDMAEETLLATPLQAEDGSAANALELVAWMVVQRFPDVKVAAPCDGERRPLAGEWLFHEKASVIEDAEGNRLASSGSINETELGWKHNWESFHVYPTWTEGTPHLEANKE